MGVLFPIIMLVLGMALGAGLGFVAAWWLAEQRRTAEQSATASLRDTFQALSSDVLTRVSQQATQQLLQLAEEKLGKQTQLSDKELTAKKQLIDQNLSHMNAELKKVNELVVALDKDRTAKFSTLSEQLAASHTHMEHLRQTTTDLKAALTNSHVRGQWGDRMADDVLRMAGFVEGVNYLRQSQLTTADGGKRQPDYTFILPHNRVVHMDVKFPLDQYLVWLEATTDAARKAACAAFIKAARARMAEAAKRDYATLSKTGDSTLDYTLVFIPNEQVYGFLLENDRAILDDALHSKVILCSPSTLFAILAVIRQAMDNFQLERTTGDILRILSGFQEQWGRFSESFAKFGDKLAGLGRDFDVLATTRRNQLERQLGKLESLKGLPAPTLPTDNIVELEPKRRTGE